MKDRREFLQLGFGSILAHLAVSVHGEDSPFLRRQPGVLIPALAAYSFRDHFLYMKGKPNQNLQGKESMSMVDFIHFCAKHKVAAELTSYFFPPDVDTAYLAKCRREAHLNGVPIAGTAVGNQFTVDPKSEAGIGQMKYVKTWIDNSVILGAPHIRVFAGRTPKGIDEETGVKHAIEALKVAGEYAGKYGIFLGIENHDSIGTSDKLLGIVEAVDNPWVGVNLDSGNFRTDDPYKDFAASVSHSVNVQLKVAMKVGGKKLATDLARIFQLLRDGEYSGFVVLEYEESENPFEKIPPILKKIRELAA